MSVTEKCSEMNRPRSGGKDVPRRTASPFAQQKVKVNNCRAHLFIASFDNLGEVLRPGLHQEVQRGGDERQRHVLNHVPLLRRHRHLTLLQVDLWCKSFSLNFGLKCSMVI